MPERAKRSRLLMDFQKPLAALDEEIRERGGDAIV
jgi:hypothetical protein